MSITTFRIEVIIDTASAEARAIETGKAPRTIARVKLQNDTSWISVAEGTVTEQCHTIQLLKARAAQNASSRIEEKAALLRLRCADRR